MSIKYPTRMRQANNRRPGGWFRVYRDRMDAGLEPCRHCGWVRTRMTFGHLVAVANGGWFRIDNVTILCSACNNQQGTEVWSHLASLLEEESEAPFAEKWTLRHRAVVVSPYSDLTVLELDLADYL